MKDIYLVNYSVQGIKALDQKVSISYYKKTISRDFDTQEYNVKGIYGMNGSGKSGIVISVDILRNILIKPGYLNNTFVQKYLDASINKQLGELSIEVDFIAKFSDELVYFRYELVLSKNKIGKYMISREQLSSKKAISKTERMDIIFEVVDGEITSLMGQGESVFADLVLQKTMNLLTMTPICAWFYELILNSDTDDYKKDIDYLFLGLIALLVFGKRLHVYIDQSDDHTEYFVKNSLQYVNETENGGTDIDSLWSHFFEVSAEPLNVISVADNIVHKDLFEYFQSTVEQLYEFIHIFKTDLKAIEIDKKENHNVYDCSLVMVYETYKIHAEFESTGIKKLVELYAYLREMVHGGIVFIDEFDSNLHDVYLCALLEYLMEYGNGQLCFTTHNVGPMDILKNHKKSIDFLSVDGRIYPWKKNGNYSPSKLYRNGMIEGSPFNVDSIDFIGIFGLSEEDE